MRQDPAAFETLLPAKERRELVALVKASFNLQARFLWGAELESLGRSLLVPCPIRTAISCPTTPCTARPLPLSGAAAHLACLADFSFAYAPVKVGERLVAYLQLGPFFGSPEQRRALLKARPELEDLSSEWPVIGRADRGVLPLVEEWLGSLVTRRVREAELMRRETELLFLVESSREVHRIQGSRELLTYLTDVSTHLTEAYSGFVLVRDDVTGDLKIEAARGVGPNFNRDYRVRLGTGVTGWVAQHGEALYVPDTSADPRYIEVGTSALSELAVPIRSGDRIVGVMAIDALERHAFTSFDLKVLESLSTQVAVALEAAATRADRGLKVRRLEAMQAVTSAIGSSLELAQVLDAVLGAVTTVFDSPAAALLISDRDGSELVVKIAGDPQLRRRKDVSLAGERGVLAHVVASRQPILVTPEDAELYGRFRAFMASDTESFMAAPISSREEFLGTLFVSGPEEGGFGREDLDLLVTLASQSAQAIVNARLYQRSQRQIGELSMMNELGKALNSSLDLDAVLEYIIGTGSSILQAQTGSVMLREAESGDLRIVAHKGLEETYARSVRMRPGEGIAGAVAQTRRAEIVADVTTDPRYMSFGEDSQPRSMISAPICHKDQLTGVINFERPLRMARSFGQEDLDLLVMLANQAAMAIENASLYRNIIQVHFETIQSLAAALEAKDAYTHGHSRRVSRDSVRVAQRLNLPSRSIETIRHAALLHDIGKIGVKDSVLLKPGPLDDQEYSHIKRHAALGASILAAVEYFQEISQIVRHHHERMDGRGYPNRLKGEEIPLGSRIIGIADAFDAMITTRPYRDGMSIEAAVSELVRHSQSQFDSALVDVFVEIIKDHHPALKPRIDQALAAVTAVAPVATPGTAS